MMDENINTGDKVLMIMVIIIEMTMIVKLQGLLFVGGGSSSYRPHSVESDFPQRERGDTTIPPPPRKMLKLVPYRNWWTCDRPP